MPRFVSKYANIEDEVERLAREEHLSACAVAARLGVRNQIVWGIFMRRGLATNRDPAPAGKFWDLLVQGTSLEGAAYPREAA